MRSQICHDLGISVVADDTVKAYFAKVQRSATENAGGSHGEKLCVDLTAILLPHVCPTEDEA
jgi:hypothetical protein